MAEILSGSGLTLMQGVVLDMLAEGKSARQIAETTGLKPDEAIRMAYDLLDGEIVTDPDKRRKLQVYRLEKLVEALWSRTMESASRDDVKNVTEILNQLNELLALNKEYDSAAQDRMANAQFYAYMAALSGLVQAFKALSPDLMEEDEWLVWQADRMEEAKATMLLEIEA